MDPSAIMKEGSFNLSEIWQFPVNAGARGPSLEFPVDSDHRNSNGDNKRQLASGDDLVKAVSANILNVNGNGVNDCEEKRLKTSGNKEVNHNSKAQAKLSSGKRVERKAQPSEPAKQDYIHVRARRGQATDSHSLAERARGEKISERMKILQDLVPGCSKVIGKALVLDEIINYIQSLQHQVEFLSMKLEPVNSRMTSGIEDPSKDFGQQTFDTAGMAFVSQPTREYSRGPSPEWLHMQVGGGFQSTS